MIIGRTGLIIIGGFIVVYTWFLFILLICLIFEVDSVKIAKKELNINKQINMRLLDILIPALFFVLLPATLLGTAVYFAYIL